MQVIRESTNICVELRGRKSSRKHVPSRHPVFVRVYGAGEASFAQAKLETSYPPEEAENGDI
jgi:hypothetical protein